MIRSTFAVARQRIMGLARAAPAGRAVAARLGV
jgi:hypothetical protein